MLNMPKNPRGSNDSVYPSEVTPHEDNDKRVQKISSDTPIEPSSYRKRANNLTYSSNSDEEQDDTHVDEIIHQFGSEVQKSITSKRRRVEIFTKQCNASRERLDSALATQRNGRSLLHEEFKKQIAAILGQWQNDIDRIKDNEEKLNCLWSQQMKLINQARAAQHERFKSMKLLHDQYCKSVSDLEATHEEQHYTIVREASKELKGLQKRFVAESKNQEVANIRKSLQSLIH